MNIHQFHLSFFIVPRIRAPYLKGKANLLFLSGVRGLVGKSIIRAPKEADAGRCLTGVDVWPAQSVYFQSRT